MRHCTGNIKLTIAQIRQQMRSAHHPSILFRCHCLPQTAALVLHRRACETHIGQSLAGTRYSTAQAGEKNQRPRKNEPAGCQNLKRMKVNEKKGRDLFSHDGVQISEHLMELSSNMRSRNVTYTVN